MAYVVIVCSRCRLARGAPETARTASCPNCGRKLRVPELRKYYRSESLDQIREAIGQLNARLKGGLDAYLEDLYESVPEKAPAPAVPDDAGELKDRKDDERLKQSGRAVPSNKLDRAIVMCLMGRAPMTPEELLPLLPLKCTVEQLDKRLEALRRSGMIYEPRSGKYALVG
jgi:DNA-directed RNA polymerase subunit RPC12/RpoP